MGLLAALVVLQTATAAKRQAIKQPDLLLRLHDLPSGYLNVELQEEQGERTFCSRLHHSHDTPKALAKFVDRFRPKGCVGAYYRLFTVPGQPSGPVLAGTGVLKMSNDRAADAAWSVVSQLLGRLFHDHPPREVTAPEKVGSETELFHAAQPRFYPFFRKVAPTASFLVWRSGNTLAVVMAVGQSFAEDDQAAVELAQRQQAHIRRPTRYTRTERFDGEVPLDDPSLELPVYWLGRNFKPGHGLPSNRLYGSYASPDGSSEETPGALVYLGYERIWLDTWTQATWPQYAGTPAVHAIASWRCTKTKTIELPGGYATIYGGYTRNYRRCPDQPPKAFTARVYLGDLVIVVNAISNEIPSPSGFVDSSPFFIETVNPYGSFKGMEAIVHGLRLRPKPVY